MRLLDAARTVLVPPLCAACGRLCRPARRSSASALRAPPRRGASRCAARARRASTAPGPRLRTKGSPATWSSALKFRRLLPVAEPDGRSHPAAGAGGLLSGAIVPVPTAPLRSLLRGFDPAAEIAAALAERSGAALRPLPAPRAARGRQVGRRRARAARPARRGSRPRARSRAASCSSTTC